MSSGIREDHVVGSLVVVVDVVVAAAVVSRPAVQATSASCANAPQYLSPIV